MEIGAGIRGRDPEDGPAEGEGRCEVFDSPLIGAIRVPDSKFQAPRT